MLRYFTAGESHGEALVAFISGVPAGLKIDQAFLDRYTEGWPVFLRYLTGDADGQPKHAEWAASVCGIDADTIKSLARRLAGRVRQALLPAARRIDRFTGAVGVPRLSPLGLVPEIDQVKLGLTMATRFVP